MQEELKENVVREPSVVYENTRRLPKSYINPFKDWAFKKIFASEVSTEVTKAFLNAVLAGKRVIDTIEFGKNEHPGEIKTEGGAILDFFCTDKAGAKFLVEVQRHGQPNYKDRTLFYASRLISDQAPKGEDWQYNLKDVYSISLLEKFSLPDSSPDQYLQEISLCNVATGKVSYDKLHFIYIEVMKFDKKETELESELDEWIYALKHAPEMTEEPLFLKAPGMKQFFHLANYANLSTEERDRHRAIQKILWDNKNAKDYEMAQMLEAREKVFKAHDEANEERVKAYEARERAYKEREKTYEASERANKEREKTYEASEKKYEARERAYKEREKTYEASEKKYEANEKKYEEAEYKKSIDIVRALQVDGISVGQIAKYTSLSEEQILAVK